MLQELSTRRQQDLEQLPSQQTPAVAVVVEVAVEVGMMTAVTEQPTMITEIVEMREEEDPSAAKEVEIGNGSITTGEIETARDFEVVGHLRQEVDI